MYWFIIVLTVGLVLAVFISLFTRIIKDNLEYRRNHPKVKKPKETPQPFMNARITVNRRESSGLTSFAVWDFFLNGENIGRIKDGETVTIGTDQKTNELTAKDSHGAECPPFRFFVKNGCDSQVVFNGGRFQNPQGMNIVLPSDEGFRKITGALKSKRWTWLWLTILLCYYTAVLFLARGQITQVLAHRHVYPEPSHWGIYLMAFAPFLPLIVVVFILISSYREVVNYLSFNYPEEWGRISREMHYFHLVNNIIFLTGR